MRVLCMCIAQKGVYSFIFELISLFVCPGNTLNLLRSILLYCKLISATHKAGLRVWQFVKIIGTVNGKS
jgi:hypothetical protein